MCYPCPRTGVTYVSGPNTLSTVKRLSDILVNILVTVHEVESPVTGHECRFAVTGMAILRIFRAILEKLFNGLLGLCRRLLLSRSQ